LGGAWSLEGGNKEVTNKGRENGEWGNKGISPADTRKNKRQFGTKKKGSCSKIRHPHNKTHKSRWSRAAKNCCKEKRFGVWGGDYRRCDRKERNKEETLLGPRRANQGGERIQLGSADRWGKKEKNEIGKKKEKKLKEKSWLAFPTRGRAKTKEKGSPQANP